jgi:nicotinamide-nucleotide amidase
MTAAVLCIGSEITRGELANSNAPWLGDRLTDLGFDVVEHLSVPDDRASIVGAIARLAKIAKVVIVTGGLGPTSDDLTTECAASALGVPLRRDEASLQRIRRRFAALDRPMPASNEKQADFPDGATILENPMGTAPGFVVDLDGARLFFLPGVPSEMKELFRESVRPAIAPLAARTSHQVHLRTFGMTESQVGELLDDLDDPDGGVTLGYRAHFPEIEVKVLARAKSPAEAEARADEIAQIARQRLGEAVFGGRDVTFPEAVGRVLRDRGLTLAIAESCTGGLVGSMVTSVPGSSNYLLLDAVTYSNASKERILGVSTEVLRAHGAVSSEAAQAMAEGALRISDADIAVAVTGIAGPGGGSESKPVGTVWFGLARRNGPSVTRRHRLPGDRSRIRTLAAYIALRMVSNAALGREIVPGVRASILTSRASVG